MTDNGRISVPRILHFSKALAALDSRILVLESFGYHVTSAVEVEEWEQCLGTQPFDLHLLCHSLSLEEARQAVEKILVFPHPGEIVLMSRVWSGSVQERLHILDDFFSPPLLLKTIFDALRSPQQQQTKSPSRDEPKPASTWH